jgi:hypothetical protein
MSQPKKFDAVTSSSNGYINYLTVVIISLYIDFDEKSIS